MMRKSKIRLNLAAAALALAIGLVFISINFWLPATGMNAIGSIFITGYEIHYSGEVKRALLSLEKGDPEAATDLLHHLDNIQKLDRAYPSKRKLYVALAGHLHDTRQFEKLHNLAKSWRTDDSRDVTAMAYWFWALLHIPERHQEGSLGLKKEWKRFSSNHMLRKFLIEIVDSGDIEALKLLCSRSHKAQKQGWHMYWYKNTDFTGQEKRLNLDLTKEEDAHYYLSIDIPGDTSILRINPPFYGEPVLISDVSLIINEQTYPVPSDRIHLVRMEREGEWLVAPGGLVSFIYFNSDFIFENIPDKPVHVKIRFKMLPYQHKGCITRQL